MLRRIWDYDIRFEATVVDKRFVDMAYFGHDKYLMLNAFLKQALARAVQPGDEAGLFLDARERLSQFVRSAVAEVNALKPDSLQSVQVVGSKAEPAMQVCDLLTGVVHAFFEPRPEAEASRKMAFACLHFARVLERETTGQARIWRWHPAREDRTPPPYSKTVSPPKPSSTSQLR